MKEVKNKFALASISCNTSRKGNRTEISFLSIYFWGGSVYIFDILKANKKVIYQGLKNLIESETLLKIVFGAKDIASLL